MGKFMTLEAALALRAQIADAGEKLVLTNGHFDLLHVGHLDTLEKARTLGDALIVGINADASTRRLKGAGRPLIPDDERARLIAALAPVDGVIIFDRADDTAIDLVEALRPEIYVKGGDYAVPPDAAHPAKSLPERAAVEAYGGRVVLIDYLPDHSTTALIEKIQRLK